MEKDVGCSPVDSVKTWATTSGSVQTIVLEVALSFATRPFEHLYWFSLCTAPSKRLKVLPPEINFMIGFYADRRMTYSPHSTVRFDSLIVRLMFFQLQPCYS